jgi:LysM repeat protein
MRINLRFLHAAPAALLSTTLAAAMFFASPFVAVSAASPLAESSTSGSYTTSQTSPLAQSLGVQTQDTSFDCVHVVQFGEDLFRIALNYGTTVTALAQANSIADPSLIFAGTSLRVPCGPVTPPQNCVRATYVVPFGQDLFRIGLMYGIDPNTLAAFNNISNPNLIFAGMTIEIPCYGSYNPGNSTYSTPAPPAYTPSPMYTP